MRRTTPLVLVCSLSLAAAACGGGNSSPDVANDSGADHGGATDTGDNGGADLADTGRPDVADTDTSTIDTTPADAEVPDTVPTDTVVPDTTPDDTVATDQGHTDTGTDTAPGDTATGDTVDPECSGECDSVTQTAKCDTNGTTLCTCDLYTGTWMPQPCTDVCAQNYQVGGQCTATADGAQCTCTNDCTDATLVEGQCQIALYTECTCASTDPCTWTGDGFCDSACAAQFPGNHYADTEDCTCSGACTFGEFMEFCTMDGELCQCGEGGQAAGNPCSTYCDPLGATTAVCNPQKAACDCGDFQCGDSSKVQAQCDAGLYTPCTCGVADPCSWSTDGACDSVDCNAMFPGQANFEEGAGEGCGG